MTAVQQIMFLVLGLGLCTWLYVLTYRQQLLMDRAEQAVDGADRLLGVATWQPEPDGEWRDEHEQRDVPEVVALDPATDEIRVVHVDTVDMHTAFNQSAAELVDRTPLVSRTVGGQTFRFREEG